MNRPYYHRRLVFADHLSLYITLEDPFENSCKILHRELREGDISSLTTTDTMRIRKNIHYARSSMIPKLPSNLDELHLALTNLGEIKINRDKLFLLINNSEKNIIAFSITGKTTKIYKNAFSDLFDKIIILIQIYGKIIFISKNAYNFGYIQNSAAVKNHLKTENLNTFYKTVLVPPGSSSIIVRHLAK
ncbi:hypothetical protein QTP88_020203 [Uroleucon formosanum]